MATNNLGLEQPLYLSDGETAVGQVNGNFTILDGIFGYVVVGPDGWIVTHNGEVVYSL